jgi:hypothetical protein
MAHAHPPSPKGFGAAGQSGHASPDDEYLATPPGSGHEHTDASVRLVVKYGLWLAIAAVLVHFGIGAMFGLFVNQREEVDHDFPLAVGQEHRLPAAPRLQQFPEVEIYEFRQREEAILKNYGWVDKEAGVVRMPIAEAMRLTVERGLPVRAQQPPTVPGQAQGSAPVQQTPGLLPADSSAGRTTERRRQ